jgi:hypothetical protein
MGPKQAVPQTSGMFRFPLLEHLNPRQELVLFG